MSLDTERCGRCGAALVSMETDPEAIRAAGCRRCEEARARRFRARTLAACRARGRTVAKIAGAAVAAVVGAWQTLVS